MRTFICPGLVNHHELEAELQSRSNIDIVGALVSDFPFPASSVNATWDGARASYKIWTTRELFKGKLESAGSPALFNKTLVTVCADVLGYLIAGRTRRTIFSGYADVFPDLVSIVRNSFAILTTADVERVVLTLVPHNLPYYVFTRVAECMGIPVDIVMHSPISNRVWRVKGLNQLNPLNAALALANVSIGDRAIRLATEYVRELKHVTGSEAYLIELQRQKKSTLSRLSSWVSAQRRWSVKATLSSPIRWRLKKKSLDSLNSVASPAIRSLMRGRNVISFFLHYQPEETTLPSGGLFVNQLLAIEVLLRYLPENWLLVIKEHPSQFTQPWTLGNPYRSPEFYESMAARKNLVVAPLDIPADELLALSSGVATIKGTIGLHAIANQKPALVFGKAGYDGCAGVFAVGDADDAGPVCKRFFASCLNPGHSELTVVEFFARVIEASFGSDGADSELRQTVREDLASSTWTRAFVSTLEESGTAGP